MDINLKMTGVSAGLFDLKYDFRPIGHHHF